jgi:hypothetical protein
MLTSATRFLKGDRSLDANPLIPYKPHFITRQRNLQQRSVIVWPAGSGGGLEDEEWGLIGVRRRKMMNPINIRTAAAAVRLKSRGKKWSKELLD